MNTERKGAHAWLRGALHVPGHLKMLQWMHLHYPDKFSNKVIDGAASNGHLKVVQWLEENRSEGCTAHAMNRAARNGHLEVVLWLLTHRTEGFSFSATETPVDVEIFHSCAEELSSDGTKSTNDQSCLFSLAHIALKRGQIPILDWLRQINVKLLSTSPIREAVSRGDTNVVKWLHENNVKLFERDLLQLAVRNGRVDVTRWLSEHGYETNTPGLVMLAAESNNMTLVRWLIENGPILDLSTATVLAKRSDYMEVMWWVSESDRMQLVLEAMRTESHRLLWLLLMRTRFQKHVSQMTIATAIHEVRSTMSAWLVENIDDEEVSRWCFSRKRIALPNEDTATKRVKD